ncbi:rRNA cytosine-C5-methyltransferase, partial [Bacteroides salyersiae]
MNLPAPFTEYTRALLGNEEYEKLSAALDQAPPVSIRLNPSFLTDANSPNSPISLLPSPFSPVPWCPEGHYLGQRLTFTFDPLFHTGCYYVQEASSMFVGQALKQYVSEEPVVMLDLCAAPGGKSTHACSLLPEGSLLVANEVIRNRSQILAENLTKWGYP